MPNLRKSLVLLGVGYVLATPLSGVVRAEESCSNPLFRTSGINYDPATVDPETMSTAGLTLELLMDFQGSGLLAGNPTMV